MYETEDTSSSPKAESYPNILIIRSLGSVVSEDGKYYLNDPLLGWSEIPLGAHDWVGCGLNAPYFRLSIKTYIR